MTNPALAAWGGETVATPAPAPAPADAPPAPTPTDTLGADTVRDLADRIGGCIQAALECLEIVLESDEVDQDSTRRAIDALKLAGNQRFIIGGGRLIE